MELISIIGFNLKLSKYRTMFQQKQSHNSKRYQGDALASSHFHFCSLAHVGTTPLTAGRLRVSALVIFPSVQNCHVQVYLYFRTTLKYW